MINKQEYLDTKREIKCLCRPNILKIANNMELSEYEKELLINMYDGKTKVQTCMEKNISASKYNDDMKILINKIYNYKNTYL